MIIVESIFVVLGDVHSAVKSEYFRRKVLPYWSAQVKGLRDDHSDSPVDIEELQQRGMVSMCLGGGGRREGVCLEGVCPNGVQRVFKECSNSVWTGGCVEGCVFGGWRRCV